MKKSVLVLAVATISAATSAYAEVSVNVNIGVPPPRVYVSTPSVHFEVAPLFVEPSRLGFYVGVDTPYDIVFSSDYYYLYYGNSWHRSGHHNGPWIEVPYRDLPPVIRKHRIEQIRSYREREYRTYRNDRSHYRGHYFRPDHDRRNENSGEEHHRSKDEWKDERRNDRRDVKEERRRHKEEWKEDIRDRKQHGGRDRD